MLTPSEQGRSRRRSSEGVHHNEPTVSQSSSAETSDGRDGLHSFLHGELRISSEVADTYCTSLTENGYDDVPSLQDATEHDLKELGVKIGHVRRIKRAVFSNCMRSNNNGGRTSGGSTRRVSELHMFSNEIAASDDSTSRKSSIQGSLLSEYARQEMMTNYAPSSRERGVDVDLASAKELLIRKQAEKIASLEAKLATAGINASGHNGDHDELLSHVSRSSRGGSADTNSKKLSPEERLEQHRQRKMRENKYKEKAGVWEPPPKKKEKNLTKRVSENDELVHKLTSDPTHRKRIDEDERRTKKSLRKSLGDDATKIPPPPSSSTAVERSRSSDSGYRQDRRRSSSSRADGNSSSSFNVNRQHHHHRTPSVSCETCGSTRDCEPDNDNPGVFYCKSCWEEYEEALDAPEVPASRAAHNHQAAPDETDPTQHALWIVHDNPQLGEKIIYSGPRSMECMLETKEPGKKNCVRIIVCDIDFSGKCSRETEVGTECIRVRNVKGYYVDHNQAPSRLSKDKSIYEFHLGEENAHLLTGRAATKSVEDFFKGCDGAIDVILDPQKDFGGWYPQREASSGGRKIAPQFRSKGVGYIRLGDDMSENGLAFLSSNACLTFLSSVGNSSHATPPPYSTNKALGHPHTAPKPSSKKRVDGAARSLPTAPRGKSNSYRRQQPMPPQSDSSDDDESLSEDESIDEVPKVSQVLKQLQNPEMQQSMKWKEKAELLSQLGKGASRPDGRHSRSAALNIIQDTLGAKNVNVHVIRSSLIAAGMIGIAMGGELVSQNSWKTIMIETLKLLKSKQCGSVAKTVLAQLHGRCFTLTNSMECVSHVLGVGLAASSASSRRKSRVSMVMESPKPRRTSSTSGDSTEVIEWLAETTERERSMEIIDPMLARNGLSMLINLFFCHVDHRDQRCRKNVLDGMMHCVLYGVQRLELDLTRVMRMCSGLKETNPKGWNQIFQNVKIILEEEQR